MPTESQRVDEERGLNGAPRCPSGREGRGALTTARRRWRERPLSRTQERQRESLWPAPERSDGMNRQKARCCQGTRRLTTSSPEASGSAVSLEGLSQLRDDFEGVGNETIVSDLEDRGFRVFVDGDDHL